MYMCIYFHSRDVSLYMHICAYVCVHKDESVWVLIVISRDLYVFLCLFVCICVDVFWCLCMCVFTRVCVRACVYASACVWKYMCVKVRVSVCVRVFVCVRVLVSHTMSISRCAHTKIKLLKVISRLYFQYHYRADFWEFLPHAKDGRDAIYWCSTHCTHEFVHETHCPYDFAQQTWLISHVGVRNRLDSFARMNLPARCIAHMKVLIWRDSLHIYGVATVSRIDKIKGLFCRISFLL